MKKEDGKLIENQEKYKCSAIINASKKLREKRQIKRS